MSEKIALGWDFSTQQIKVLAVGFDSGKILFEDFIKFDDDLPSFGTRGGVHICSDGVTVTAPTIIWVHGLDMMMDRLCKSGLDLSRVGVICGAAQQHGSVYWRAGASRVLAELDPTKRLAEQLQNCFSVPDSPVWMDASTEKQCREIEAFAGGPESLAKLTGARAFHRYTAAQIRRLAELRPAEYANTERISLVSSFAASIFLGALADTSAADASGMNLMDVRRHCWLPGLCEFVAPGLLGRLGGIVPGRTLIGCLSQYFVSRYCLPPQCQVAAFTGDNPATLAGLRLRAGSMAVSLGSSTCASIWADSVPELSSLGCVVMANVIDSSACMPILVMKNGSLTRESVRDEFAEGSWRQFDLLLDSTPPGNNGEIGLYFDCVEIAPAGLSGRFRFDSDDQPVTLLSSPGAEVRACVESHALLLRLLAEPLGLSGSVLATGGGSRSQRLLQVLADALNRPVLTQDAPNSAALGAAFVGISAIRSQLPHHLALPPKSQEPALAAEPRREAADVYERLLPRFASLLARVQRGQ